MQALVALAFSAAFAAGVAGPLVASARFLSGESPLSFKIADARRVISVEDLLSDGHFVSVEYMYGLSYSPDGQWLSFLVDAKPPKGGPTRYYVYIARPDGAERTMVLETRFGPELWRSLAWTAKGLVLASPTFEEDISWPEKPEPPTAYQIRIRGTDPTLSPDGRTLAFRRHSRDGATLWCMRFDRAGQPAQWSGHISGFAPLFWAPDSQALAFLSPREVEGGEGLWQAAVGGKPKLVCGEPVARFAWSPAGEFLAAITVDNELKVIGPGGKAKTLSEQARDFEWSPAGDALCYIGYMPDGVTEALYWCSVRSGKVRRLAISRAPGSWDFSHMRFSPDGSLVYVRAAAGKDVTGDGMHLPRTDRSLFVVSVDGSEGPTALPIAGNVLKPAPSPDGRYLVVGAEREEGSWLWCVDMRACRVANLGRVPVEKYAYSLAWAPDGKTLVLEDQGNVVRVILAKP